MHKADDVMQYCKFQVVLDSSKSEIFQLGNSQFFGEY